jgi:hypothetical protein
MTTQAIRTITAVADVECDCRADETLRGWQRRHHAEAPRRRPRPRLRRRTRRP